MFGFGYRLIIPGAGMDRTAIPPVDLVSWTYYTEALSTVTGRVTTTAILSGPQYPAAGYGTIRFRFTHTPTDPDLVITSNWGRVDLFPNHQTITNITGSQYLGKIYGVVEYEVKVGGVTIIPWKIRVGTTLIIPAYGGAPHSWP